ncbi:sugar ABC transporter permease [Clostridiaceae bacterium HSG29]|nr:sugar ABC transporter permease [Clostridiaceae bacterium HSG29]
MELTKSKKKRKGGIANYSKYGQMFAIPFIIGFLLFQLYPIIYTITLSFTDLAGWETELNFVGFKNYIHILHNDHFLRALKNTWIIWGMNFIPQLLVALILAKWFTDNAVKIKGEGMFKAIFYLPNIITAASLAILFNSLFGFPHGPINQILIHFDVLQEPFEFFRSKPGTRIIVAFIQFWRWYGSTFIILCAGIMGINPSLFEAAKIDGASDWKIFTNITLPLLKPITLYILITSLVGGMQMFDIPFLLTGGGPDYAVETGMIYVYNQAFTGNRNFFMSATASVVLLLIIMVFSALIYYVMNKDKRKVSR